jgi:predicted RNA binding protein YcfA (HicA-like mRNA interferase family)
VSNLVISQKKFIIILKQHGFYFKRQESSHQFWEGIVQGEKRLVVVDVNYAQYSGWLLSIMIRQSGLQKKIFRD